MNWLKTVVMTALMAVVAFGLYRALTKPPESGATSQGPPPAWRNETPEGPVAVDLGQAGPKAISPSEHEEPAPETPAKTADDEKPSAPVAPELPPSGASAEAEARVASALPGDVATGVALAADGSVQQASVGAGTGPDLQAADPASPEPPSAASQEEPSGFAAAMKQIDRLHTQQRWAEALMLASPWYQQRDSLAPAQRQWLLDTLDRLAGRVVYSREHLLEQPHEVAPGETLEQIAQRYQVPASLLAKINGLADPRSIQPGDTLKVVTGPFQADVELSKFQLTLFLNDGRYAGRFPIGVGSEVPAEEGEYTVSQKMANPPYRNIPGGAANNPLGQRLVEFGDHFALHGAVDPHTVGQPCHEGCLRMTARDIEDVYDILTVGSKVVVRR